MTEFSIHHVERVQAAAPTDLGTAYSRRIYVTDSDGNTHSVILFADKPELLEVRDADEPQGALRELHAAAEEFRTVEAACHPDLSRSAQRLDKALHNTRFLTA